MKPKKTNGGRGFTKNDPRHQMKLEEWRPTIPNRLLKLSIEERRERERQHRIRATKRKSDMV